MTGVVDRRSAGEIGRRARVELVFAVRGGRTVLAHAYSEPPYRVLPGFDHPFGLHVMLASSAPGLFAADALEQSVLVESGARVLLTSQSAMQLHPAVDADPARLRARYVVRDGGSLRCDWDPLIPFAGAALEHQVTIELAGDARLWWMDATMTGRAGRGERWRLSSLAHDLRVVHDGTLEYLERYVLRPALDNLTTPWIAGGADYFGTAMIKGDGPARERAERLHRELAAVEGVDAAADALSDSLIVIRMVSASGAAFHRARSLLRQYRHQD
jgi:urease accessory protein UreH